MTWLKHLIPQETTIKNALGLLDELAQDAILFVVDDDKKLISSITDGDIRRGLMKGISLEKTVVSVGNRDPKFLHQNAYNSLIQIKEFRQKNYKILPIVTSENEVIDCLNFRTRKTILPIDCVIMAGGKGERLRPLTEKTPKPLLKVGNKPILEYNIDLFKKFGVSNCWLSINYLSEQLEQFAFENQSETFKINAFRETFPMGTIGSIKLINQFKSDTILVCNSDLLHNVDLEAFFIDFQNSNADFSVVTIPYTINVPYAILEVENDLVKDLKEKPSYTYYSNGGIYLFKVELLNLIPSHTSFSATDFMEKIIAKNLKIKSFPHHGYWLDIGKHDDYKRANEDIKKLNLF